MKAPDSKTSLKPIRVAFFHRKPRALGNFSIETYFQQIREHLPPPFQPVYVEMPYESNGLWRRLANAIYCYFKQEDINHITGDIHYVGCLLKRRKTILTYHDCGNLHESQGIKYLLIKLFWFIIPCYRSIQLTAVSTSTKNDILYFTNFPENKIKIIYVSILDIFQSSPKFFNQQKPRILHIGTAPNKNLERLIPALKGLPCTLVIVGKISETTKNHIKDNDIIAECIERRLSDEEMLYQYHKCDILSMVSTLEGFGMPIVEANAIGRPVITSNTTSMPEIARDAALLVDPYDITAIREGFINLIENSKLREILIKNGFQNHRRFQPNLLSQQYAELYLNILSKSVN